jgi:hypothetical protein
MHIFLMALIATIEVSFDTSRFKITNDPLGTGTRIALEVSLPSNDGNALATAVPAQFL